MFYIAEALLEDKDLRFSKHGVYMALLENIMSKQAFLTRSFIAGY
jgi:uncharacterized protein (UPF0332 family)